ncbi:MAG: MFS transporter [Clostridiales bacterium]|nr:MFS transporter [Clostridiales bacterium]
MTQAVAATFLPLLFVHFQSEFGFSLNSLTVLITVTFITEIVIDALSPFFIKKIGYRKSMILANILSFSGFAGLSFLPDIFQNHYIGFLVSAALYAIGGGFDEVLVSPIVEACPTKNKAAAMRFVHSAFCIGCAAVVLGSTLFFKTAGIENWRFLAVIWAAVPLFNAVYFCFVPIRTLEEEKGRGKFSDMIKNPLFWVLGGAMVCTGASELSMSQWASAFAESGLHVSKTTGDLLGPCAFAALMGVSRVIYGNVCGKVDIIKIMMCGALLCIASYLTASLSENPVLALIGCCVCGIAVAPMWPGAFSLAAKHIPNASTAMFAAYAFLGDVGCTAGPTMVGVISGNSDDNISKGLIWSVIFPALMFLCLIFVKRLSKSNVKIRKK